MWRLNNGGGVIVVVIEDVGGTDKRCLKSASHRERAGSDRRCPSLILSPVPCPTIAVGGWPATIGVRHSMKMNTVGKCNRMQCRTVSCNRGTTA